MKRTTVDDLHKQWMKNPKYRREYEALEEEFSLAAALIEARARAGLTQEQVARRMKTTQAVVARLEGGGSMPSTRPSKSTPRQPGPGSKSALSRKERGLNDARSRARLAPRGRWTGIVAFEHGDSIT